jgi:hypothetical protein
MLLRTLLCLGLSLSFHSMPIAKQRENPDEFTLHRAKLVAQSDRIEVYRDGVDVDHDFIGSVEQLYLAIEAKLNRKFDEVTFGRKIKIVVSDSVKVSHVWRGYQHMTDPKAVVFLNARAYKGFQTKSNATLAHELTHLFTWKYNSHSLREGIADYIARAVMPNTAVGPNEANARPAPVDWALKYLGSNYPPPSELLTDAEFRRNYYYLSYVLVNALIERSSMPDFLKFYDSIYSEALFESTFKIKRADLICQLNLNTNCKQ